MAYLAYPFRLLIRWLGNLLRRLSKAPEYVTFTLEEPYPEMVPPRLPFPRRLLSPRKASLRDLARELRHVAYDRRVKGVVLKLRSAPAPLAQVQSLRDLIVELRDARKRVVVWSNHYDMAKYYVACVADEVLLQHAGSVAVMGLGQRFVFLADALERIGLQAEIVQISPYKTAGDMLTRREMSDEARAMVNWLIDDTFEQCIEGIARGRSMSSDET